MKYGGNKLLNSKTNLGGRKDTLRMERNNNSSYTKKGDRDRCENYGGIALGKAAYKILSNIKLGKIKPCIEKVMRS